MRSTKLLALATALMSALAPAESYAEEKVEKKNPWRMSEIDYGHSFTALSLNRSADPTYNPVYSHNFSFQPRWYFHDLLYARARLDLEQELTNSDDTTYYREWLLGGLQLDLGYSGYTEPITGIKVAGYWRFLLPTSKALQAATVITSTGPTVTATRKFPVLQGLTVGMQGRIAKTFSRFTTVQYDAPTINCGDADSAACGEFQHTGVRVESWGYLWGFTLSFQPIKDLSIDSLFVFRRSVVHPVTPFEVGGVVLSDAGDQRTRYSQMFTLSASYPVWEFVSAAAGVSSLYPELGPDGTYQTPFFNRYTVFELGLAFDVDGAVSLFQ